MPLKSFINVPPDSDFSIQNLPFGVFKPATGAARIGVAIGDFVLDLSVLENGGHFRLPEFKGRAVFAAEALNAFLDLGRPAWRKAREVIQNLLNAETSTLRDDGGLRTRALHLQKDVTMRLPARIGPPATTRRSKRR